MRGPTGDLTRKRRAVPHSLMKILIDNGHGIQTKGKRSPDGKLLEYAYTRELARQIVKILQSRDYDAELLVPEDDDIPLSERVRRTNAHCQALGKSNVILFGTGMSFLPRCTPSAFIFFASSTLSSTIKVAPQDLHIS